MNTLKTLPEILLDQINASHPLDVLDTDFDNADYSDLPVMELEEVE